MGRSSAGLFEKWPRPNLFVDRLRDLRRGAWAGWVCVPGRGGDDINNGEDKDEDEAHELGVLPPHLALRGRVWAVCGGPGSSKGAKARARFLRPGRVGAKGKERGGVGGVGLHPEVGGGFLEFEGVLVQLLCAVHEQLDPFATLQHLVYCRVERGGRRREVLDRGGTERSGG